MPVVRSFQRWLVLAVGCCWLLTGSLVCEAATWNFEKLLPGKTPGFVSIRDLTALSTAWDQTQFGQLLADPVMKPFSDHLREQLDAQINDARDRFGITISDLESLSGGELTFAVVRAEDGKPALVMLADITDHEEQAQRVLEKVSAKLVSRGAKRTVSDTTTTLFRTFVIPPKGEIKTERTAVYFQKGTVLGFSSHVATAQLLLGRIGGSESSDSLARKEAFQNVIGRCLAESGDQSPHLEFYLEPLALAQAVRELRTDSKPRGQDMIKILTEQGFGGVRAVGGNVQLAVGPFGSLYRVAVYAPPPYELAMRMLKFPTGADFAPQSWVPRDVVSYRTFYWDMQNAFARFDTLFDATVGEGEKGVFNDILESAAKDPDGPRIDIRTQLVAHLGQRATVISDHVLPVTKSSRRRLFAAELKDPQSMAESVERSMANDPAVLRRQIGDFSVFEIIAEDSAYGDNFALNAALPGEEGVIIEDERTRLPNAAVTVAFGHLLVASDIDLLEKVLTQTEARHSLARDVDYQMVAAQLKTLTGNEQMAQGFVRFDEQFRIAYELFRAGQLPGAELPLAKVLDALLGEGIEGIERKPKVDASRLPDYQVVRRYLGAAGAVVTNDPEGWFITGFTLNKEMPLASRPE